jgi:hypothetical protein
MISVRKIVLLMIVAISVHAMHVPNDQDFYVKDSAGNTIKIDKKLISYFPTLVKGLAEDGFGAQDNPYPLSYADSATIAILIRITQAYMNDPLTVPMVVEKYPEFDFGKLSVLLDFLDNKEISYYIRKVTNKSIKLFTVGIGDMRLTLDKKTLSFMKTLEDFFEAAHDNNIFDLSRVNIQDKEVFIFLLTLIEHASKDEPDKKISSMLQSKTRSFKFYSTLLNMMDFLNVSELLPTVIQHVAGLIKKKKTINPEEYDLLYTINPPILWQVKAAINSFTVRLIDAYGMLKTPQRPLMKFPLRSSRFVCFSTDGTKLFHIHTVLQSNNEVVCFDLEKNSKINSVMVPRDYAHVVANTEGTHAVIFSKEQNMPCYIWNTVTNDLKEVALPLPRGVAVSGILINKDGTQLCVWTQNAVIHLDGPHYSQRAVILPHNRARSIIGNPLWTIDGTTIVFMIAVGNAITAIHFYDCNTRALRRIDVNIAISSGIAFDSNNLIVTDPDGTVFALSVEQNSILVKKVMSTHARGAEAIFSNSQRNFLLIIARNGNQILDREKGMLIQAFSFVFPAAFLASGDGIWWSIDGMPNDKDHEFICKSHFVPNIKKQLLTLIDDLSLQQVVLLHSIEERIARKRRVFDSFTAEESAALKQELPQEYIELLESILRTFSNEKFRHE